MGASVGLPPADDKSVASVGVLDKSMTVLDAVASTPAGDGASLAHLVAATGLPRATVHRLAVALEGHGLLRRDDDGLLRAGQQGIGVAADDRHARERVALFRSDDVDDALARRVHRVERDGELGAVRPEGLDLLAGHRIGDLELGVGGGDVVVLGGEGQLRVADTCLLYTSDAADE